MTFSAEGVYSASAALREFEATSPVPRVLSMKANAVTGVSLDFESASAAAYARNVIRVKIELSGESAAFWAKKAGIDASTLSLYLSGKRPLGRESAMRLVRVLGFLDSREVWPAPMAGVRS